MTSTGPILHKTTFTLKNRFFVISTLSIENHTILVLFFSFLPKLDFHKMNDSVSILVAVFLILIALRWMLGKVKQYVIHPTFCLIN